MSINSRDNAGSSLETLIIELKQKGVDVVVHDEKKEISEVFASNCTNGGSSSASCANSQSCGRYTEGLEKAA